MAENCELDYLYYKYINIKNDLEHEQTTLFAKLEAVNSVINDIECALIRSGEVLIKEHWENTSKPEDEFEDETEDESEDEEWETFYNEAMEDE